MILTKICGICDQNIAETAVRAGANALGFVFYKKSPRAVTPEVARQIVATLPPFVTTVGLFVNEKAETIREIYQQVGLNLIQFHGDESPEFCESIGLPYIRAIRVVPELDFNQVCQTYPQSRAFLLDAAVSGAYGGTGASFDWSLIPAQLEKPVILAGGLNSDNVIQACLSVHPYAVDVSSGVEQTKGVKDPSKIWDFLHKVQMVNARDF